MTEGCVEYSELATLSAFDISDDLTASLCDFKNASTNSTNQSIGAEKTLRLKRIRHLLVEFALVWALICSS